MRVVKAISTPISYNAAVSASENSGQWQGGRRDRRRPAVAARWPVKGGLPAAVAAAAYRTVFGEIRAVKLERTINPPVQNYSTPMLFT